MTYTRPRGGYGGYGEATPRTTVTDGLDNPT
jgi:hypothetical protein